MVTETWDETFLEDLEPSDLQVFIDQWADSSFDECVAFFQFEGLDPQKSMGKMLLYARSLKEAKEQRLEGNIDIALRLERISEHLFLQILL